ncbi:MAG TPA: hypothetical protein VFP84_15000 [Kofleriaceae bacterium]|nr:hypothetical protein [Kofleriaceae bacterium]
MKKIKKQTGTSRKLKLERETLVKLQTEDLALVQGAALNEPPQSSPHCPT